MIDMVTNAGALPTLELSVRFAARRQEILAHNIANLSTPDFQPLEAPVEEFRDVLRDAVRERRARTGGHHGELDWKGTRQIVRGPGGQLRLNPTTPSGNIMFHDRNNRDLERAMQDLAENAAAFQVASELLRNRMQALRGAVTNTT